MEGIISFLCNDDDVTLINSLGDWNKFTDNEWLDTWDWFLDHNNLIYHHNQDNTWEVTARTINSHYSYEADPRVCDTVPSQTLSRVSTISYVDRILVRNSLPQVSSVVEEVTDMVLD